MLFPFVLLQDTMANMARLKTYLRLFPLTSSALYWIILFSWIIRLIFIGFNPLLVEEAYYWNYATHLDFGYLDHPPMVALLIKPFTSLFGPYELNVRIASLLCWTVTAFFSFKLTQLIHRGAGWYAVFLLSILPFFFLQSLVMTPDQPLIVCWSAALYCLYRALVQQQAPYWYGAGLWLGLGMLSKYTIVLLGPATLLYLCFIPTARQWFFKKEPYLCVLIALMLFTPVIYWNATHEWVSFAFQSTRRFTTGFSFSFHHFWGLLIFFLTPLGFLNLIHLFQAKSTYASHFNLQNTIRSTTNNHHSTAFCELNRETIRFIQCFTTVPLVVFGLFSLQHDIKFNWIGPGLLACIPWIALSIQCLCKRNSTKLSKGWFITAIILLISYVLFLFCITFGRPNAIHHQLFKKFIAWDNLTQQFHTIAREIEEKTHQKPIFVPLDLYNIASELSFYQAKFLAKHAINTSYHVMGGHVFGNESLMFRYWSPQNQLPHTTLILIATEPQFLESSQINTLTYPQSKTRLIWSYGPDLHSPIRPYYYRVVKPK